jgi:hypothetical protein
MSFHNDYPDHDYSPRDADAFGEGAHADMPDPTRDYYDQDFEEEEEEYDGQPDEYTEWQDLYDGDEYYDHSEAQWDGDF